MQVQRTIRTIPRLVTLPIGVFSLVVGGHDLLGDAPWTTVCVGLFTASMMFCWISVLHETAHCMLFQSIGANVWLGRALGSVMFLPYTVYRESHFRHHSSLNQPSDWELWPYSDPRASRSFRRVFLWFDIFFGIVTAPYIYGRIYFDRESPLHDSVVRRTIRREYLGVILVWAIILLLVAWSDAWFVHLKGTLWPMWLAGLLQTCRKFTEHLGMASSDPLRGTRTVLPSRWWLRIWSYFNFELFVHGFHHRHPRAAHETLACGMRQHVADRPNVQYPVFDSYWSAARDMLPHLLFNPGCGHNASAEIQPAQPWTTNSPDGKNLR